ncbi:hypothetical protein KLVA_23300 [Klebsiella variicola]|nr:hypothetical protein KLVA_23300 [Klebsiella variicola]GKJ24951.1 hypothetical protein NUKP24_12320 [Klebsiella variicola]GKM57917.1 hypothetical protein NUKP67_28980 [Klebsiella variicola]
MQPAKHAAGEEKSPRRGCAAIVLGRDRHNAGPLIGPEATDLDHAVPAVRTPHLTGGIGAGV